MKRSLLLLLLCLSACTTIPSPEARRTQADILAREHGWHAQVLSADAFDLIAYAPVAHTPTDVLTVYIEGDGFAWVTASRPSTDPTPIDPLGLRLALAQPEGVAVYLARPCQYVNAEAIRCHAPYWTGRRFAPEVIAASNRAIDTLMQRFGASSVVLVGYSGGGAVAALAAARRKDVSRLVTVAGNLDHRAWTTYHRLNALAGSLNPADEVRALERVEQWHFAGAKDAVVPPLLVQQFAMRFSEGLRPELEIIPDFDHRCCWVEKWPELWRRTVSAR